MVAEVRLIRERSAVERYMMLDRLRDTAERRRRSELAA